MEVSEAVLSILNREGMSPSFNSTFIALIPKKSNVESISNFRLTNFCNVLYKLIFKVITNRLKPIMNDIIFSNQSGFLAWRLITDNIIVAHKLLHTLKRKKKRKIETYGNKIGSFQNL